MKEPIYYYKDGKGRWHFSNGQIKEDAKVAQYIRMLRYAKYPLQPLYLDNPTDYETIKSVFNIDSNTPWQNIYNQ